MGSYQEAYEYVKTLLQQDIKDEYAYLETLEDQDEARTYEQGVIRGLEYVLELLDINQPVK